VSTIAAASAGSLLGTGLVAAVLSVVGYLLDRNPDPNHRWVDSVEEWDRIDGMRPATSKLFVLIAALGVVLVLAGLIVALS